MRGPSWAQPYTQVWQSPQNLSGTKLASHFRLGLLMIWKISSFPPSLKKIPTSNSCICALKTWSALTFSLGEVQLFWVFRYHAYLHAIWVDNKERCSDKRETCLQIIKSIPSHYAFFLSQSCSFFSALPFLMKGLSWPWQWWWSW